MTIRGKPVNPARPEEDPMVVAAIQEQRAADDILVVACPHCGWWSYYNEGSHANCRNCSRDLMPLVEEGEAITLADYWTGAAYPCDA
jgi:hypothetical protein